MVLLLLILDFLILGLAIIFRVARPKEINPIYGFRTRRSMLNQDTWRVANVYWTNLNLIGSVFVLFFQGTLLVLKKPMEGVISGTCIAWVVMLIASIVLTNRVLLANFDKEGRWK